MLAANGRGLAIPCNCASGIVGTVDQVSVLYTIVLDYSQLLAVEWSVECDN